MVEMVDGNGQAEAFAEFFRAHYSLVVSTCERRLHDHGAAEDAAAEVFRVAWQHFAKGEELTLPWLYTVVRNVVGNEYRRTDRLGNLVGKIRDQTPRGIGDGDDYSEVRAAMMRLPRVQRELLFYTYWEDLSAAEVAQILGTTTAAVWVRLSRARTALRRELAGATNAHDSSEEVTQLG